MQTSFNGRFNVDLVWQQVWGSGHVASTHSSHLSLVGVYLVMYGSIWYYVHQVVGFCYSNRLHSGSMGMHAVLLASAVQVL